MGAFSTTPFGKLSHERDASDRSNTQQDEHGLGQIHERLARDAHVMVARDAQDDVVGHAGALAADAGVRDVTSGRSNESVGGSEGGSARLDRPSRALRALVDSADVPDRPPRRVAGAQHRRGHSAVDEVDRARFTLARGLGLITHTEAERSHRLGRELALGGARGNPRAFEVLLVLRASGEAYETVVTYD